jgi:hypothetical protein
MDAVAVMFEDVDVPVMGHSTMTLYAPGSPASGAFF